MKAAQRTLFTRTFVVVLAQDLMSNCPRYCPLDVELRKDSHQFVSYLFRFPNCYLNMYETEQNYSLLETVAIVCIYCKHN